MSTASKPAITHWLPDQPGSVLRGGWVLLFSLLATLAAASDSGRDAAAGGVATDQSTGDYTGEPISLSFQDIPLRSALQIMADYQDFSLVAGDAVAGNITLVLKDIPWDQALALMLRTGNLGSRLEGTVLYVAPAEEIAAQQQLALRTVQQAQAQAPLVTEFIQVNYANANDLLVLLTGAETAGAGVATTDPDVEVVAAGAVPASGMAGEVGLTSAVNLLSPRGTATVDERTNILIVSDTEEKLQQVRTMLARLDVAVPQVLIEARIVNVATDSSHDLGIRWGVAGRIPGDQRFRYGGSQAATVNLANNEVLREVARQQAAAAGSLARVQALQQGAAADLTEALVQQAIASVPIPPAEILFPQSLAVDLGVKAPESTSFAVGFTGSSGLIELELSALESTGNGEVVARPKVTTQDKVTAEIRSGVRIPFQAQAGGTAGGSVTQFEEAVLSLQVTPQITPDGRINMELAIQQDSVAPGIGLVPAINTNQVSTTALVNNGETIVLGGVFREENTTTEAKTPLLGDIPWLGRLFKRTGRTSRRTELLIFITPRIIDV